MSMNLKVVRIKSKLEEMYNNKIDITDVESNNKFPDQFYTRAIAAQAIIMRCGISEDVAGKCITDGNIGNCGCDQAVGTLMFLPVNGDHP